MREKLILLVLASALTPSLPLASQLQRAPNPSVIASVSDASPAAPSAAAPSDPWMAPPAALPPILTPPAVGASEPESIQEPPGMVPVLFGIFGGIAGLFVGDWWADRECDSDCGAGRIAMLFLAGGLGAMIGWVVGGGDVPQPPPERWP